MAYGVTFLIVAVTIYIAIVSLHKDDSPDYSIISQTLIPIWATWIGTILAFYFGKENLDSATKSYREVIKRLTPEEKMATLYIEDEMLPFDEIVSLDFETQKGRPIQEILDNREFKEYHRYVFFDNKHLKKVIDRSLFLEFINMELNKTQDMEYVNKLTFEDMLTTSDESIQKKLNKALVYVLPTDTLLDAKNKVERISGHLDIFVTATGDLNGEVLGMITNNMIFKAARL